MFADRREAGKRLANRLVAYKNRPEVLVLALPRGGVVVADEVAKALGLPLDVFIVRKLGSPMHEEYAIGALAETSDVVWHEAERKAFPDNVLAALVQREQVEADRRVRVYRQGRPLPDVAGKTVIIIDDGVATGYTMRAALLALRRLGAGRIVVAVPHGAADTLEILRVMADEVVAVLEPRLYGAVGAFYRNFPQVTDDEVLACLRK